MNEAAKNELEVAQDRGAALLDNTTLAGVGPALSAPQTASFADVQSLACVLEAVILHESLFADSWYNQELIPYAILELTERAEGSGDTRHIFTMFDFVDKVSAAVRAGTEEGLPMFTFALVTHALDRLERALRPGGGLDRQHELLVERLSAGQNISAHYLGPRPLREEITELSGRGGSYTSYAERSRAKSTSGSAESPRTFGFTRCSSCAPFTTKNLPQPFRFPTCPIPSVQRRCWR